MNESFDSKVKGSFGQCDAPPNFLIDPIASAKVKTIERERVGVHSLICNTSRVKRHAGVSRWELGQMTSMSIIHIDLHKLNNKLVNV
jgi:hypothetical protein